VFRTLQNETRRDEIETRQEKIETRRNEIYVETQRDELETRRDEIETRREEIETRRDEIETRQNEIYIETQRDEIKDECLRSLIAIMFCETVVKYINRSISVQNFGGHQLNNTGLARRTIRRKKKPLKITASYVCLLSSSTC
jgi:chromosome segregation ATPase